MDTTPKCCIIVYGCAKNQVDAEEMAERLREAGYYLTPDATSADVVVVHTCGFIEDAKKESIEGILSACELVKEAGGQAPVVVTGCLSQRYPQDLLKEIPEIAGVAGTGAPRDIVEIVKAALEGKKVNLVGEPGRGAPGGLGKRQLLSPGQTWAYLRVSEGCRHHCTYCAIPSMRGSLQSRPIEDVVAEARSLVGAGVREVNLIAQDLADYGSDWGGGRQLPALVRELVKIPDLAWVRLLYLRPDGVTPELADAMAHYKVAPYVDLPAEHGSGKILRLMGRPGPDQIVKAVETLRTAVPRLFVRTTIITGFPGETEKDLEQVKDLLSAIGAHRVGVFPYSREEGTPAYNLPDPVPTAVARERAEAIRRYGLELARVNSKSLVGSEIPVILVKPSVRPGYYVARGPHQAPEVDGRTYIRYRDTGLPGAGTFFDVRVHRAGVLDLYAYPEEKPEPS
jgi:ribosomal protein S12 methylthiotransferase